MCSGQIGDSELVQVKNRSREDLRNTRQGRCKIKIPVDVEEYPKSGSEARYTEREILPHFPQEGFKLNVISTQIPRLKNLKNTIIREDYMRIDSEEALKKTRQGITLA